MNDITAKQGIEWIWSLLIMLKVNSITMNESRKKEFELEYIDWASHLMPIENALTELEEIKKEVIDRQETEDSLTKWVNELVDEIDELKRYPTQEEVCKALSEYHLFDMVEYDKKTQTFYSGDNICYMGIDCQDKPIIIFDYELPPHLITMIGRFYQSLEEELK